MFLTKELEDIFQNILEDSKKSSFELLEKYKNSEEYVELSAKIENISNNKYNNYSTLRNRCSSMSDVEFFEKEVNNQFKKIIAKIISEYSEILSKEVIDKLKSLILEIVYDEKDNHDISVTSKGIKINLFKVLKDKDLYSSIINTIGTLPHELFHFIFSMLKPGFEVDERMVYELPDGRVGSVLGMVGHMLNEGFVEKLSSEFCEENDIFYIPSPKYICLTKLCTYIMKNCDISLEDLTKYNYEDIFKLFSNEVVEKYKEVEREEYIYNFEVRLNDDTELDLSTEEGIKSYNQKLSSIEIEEIRKVLYFESETELLYESLKMIKGSKLLRFMFKDDNCILSIYKIDNGNILHQSVYDVDNIFIDALLKNYIHRFCDYNNVLDYNITSKSNENYDIQIIFTSGIFIIENININLVYSLEELLQKENGQFVK